MEKEVKIKVGISVGDLNGIGMEVILKTFADKRMFDFCTPILFASQKAVAFYRKLLKSETAYQEISSLDKTIAQKLNVFSYQ